MAQKGTADERVIWCDLHKTYMQLGACKSCPSDRDYRYREKGAMRKVNRGTA